MIKISEIIEILEIIKISGNIEWTFGQKMFVDKNWSKLRNIGKNSQKWYIKEKKKQAYT